MSKIDEMTKEQIKDLIAKKELWGKLLDKEEKDNEILLELTAKLTKEIVSLKSQIKQMQCCENCFYDNYKPDGIHFKMCQCCENNEKWLMKADEWWKE